MTPQQEQSTRLGFLSVAPFVFGAGLLWLSPVLIPPGLAVNIGELVLVYGAVVAVFLAGMEAVAGLRAPGRLAQPLIAALIAWFIIAPLGAFAPPALRYLLLLALFVLLNVRDLKDAAAGDFPSWYGPLRTRLTFWTMASLTLIMLRLMMWDL